MESTNRMTKTILAIFLGLVVVVYSLPVSAALPPTVPPAVLWTATFDSGTEDSMSGVAVDPDGNPTVTGMTDYNAGMGLWRTIKYSGATGAVLWNVTFNPGGSGFVHDVAVGVDRHPVVTGDGFTIQYDGTTGAVRWVQTVSGASVAVGPDGHPVVAGAGAVTKLNGATGAVLWTQGGGSGYGVAIGVDGHPVVTDGNSLTKRDGANGAIIWSAVPVGDLGSAAAAAAIAIGSDGHPVTAGRSCDGCDFLISKYNGSSGDLLWTTSSSVGTFATAIALGPDGHPVATGRFQEVGLPQPITVAKYDGSNGALLWNVHFDIGAGRGDAVGVTQDNNPFAGGISCDPVTAQSCDLRLIKYGYLSTPAGATDVSGIVNISSVQVRFANVTEAGITTIFPTDSPGAIPPGFTLLDPSIAFEVQTTAQFSGTVQVCASYPDDPGGEASYRLFHNEGGTLVDRTVSNDTGANVICAEVTSLSAFAVLRQKPTLVVSIDIKPGSYPNAINLGSQGTVPVAILSSPTFDARTVDPTTIVLASAAVKLKGKGTPMASFQDVNGDGLPDLVVHVVTDALQLSATDTTAVLEGRMFDGTLIRGSDSVRVVQ